MFLLMSYNRVNIAAEKGGESCWTTLRGDPMGRLNGVAS